MKMIRSLFAIILTFTIAFNGFARPAHADNNAYLETYSTPVAGVISEESAYPHTDLSLESTDSSPFIDSFLRGLGMAIGTVGGTVVACYAVDALIMPVAPPVGVYLAGVCPFIGAAAGGVSGGLAGGKLADAH